MGARRFGRCDRICNSGVCRSIGCFDGDTIVAIKRTLLRANDDEREEDLREKELFINVVDTSLNTADLGTKFLDAARRAALLAMLPLAVIQRMETF